MKKIITCFLLIVFLYFLIYLSLSKIELNKSNENFVNGLLKNSNYYLYPNKSNSNIVYNFINYINNIELNRPISIVEKKFYKSNSNIEFGYIQNDIVSTPKVFIYSTHYNESYIDDKTVIDASYLLQSKLNEIGIISIVSQRSVKDYLKYNDLTFKDSYKATRSFVIDALEEYDSLELIIDLHRDATSKENSTSSLDGTDYAKLMFVMNENYSNITLADKLNDIILSKKNITRGIYHKKIDNFNQDLSDNVLLIEVGGNYNNFTEVENSISILALSIKELINEKN
jgi:stage II sporulation protein P